MLLETDYSLHDKFLNVTMMDCQREKEYKEPIFALRNLCYSCICL